ncbi:transposase [Streptomyces rectiviolaceus]|uniref:transposase n=1 Tax=Streptomyces rectiviolaceus TaxID=332591 RepID=UPI003CD08CF5
MPLPHRSKKVRDWHTAHPDEVELHFLPPYSPELNLDELVNVGNADMAVLRRLAATPTDNSRGISSPTGLANHPPNPQN